MRSRQSAILHVCWSFWGLSALAVIARLVARSTLLHGPGYGADDSVIVCTELLATAAAVGCHFMVRNGLGRDFWMLAPAEITAALRVGCASTNLVMMTWQRL